METQNLEKMDLINTNDEVFKGWIFSDGRRILFPFNKEHYTFIPDSICGDYTVELVRGGIRLVKFNDMIAFNIHKVVRNTLNEIIYFLKTNSLSVTNIVIEAENDHEDNRETLIFKSLKELYTYFNLKFI